MGVLRHRLLVMALMTIAAIAVAGCGGDDKSAEPPQELEDTLGFGGEDSAKELQSRVENRIRECMKAQGFEYSPGGPVRAAAGADRQGAHHRRGVHQAVRLRHQHAVRQGQPAVRSQRADPHQPLDGRPRRLRPRARRRQPRRDVRGGRRLRRLQRARRLHEGGQRRGVRRRGGADVAGRASSTSSTSASSRTSGW